MTKIYCPNCGSCTRRYGRCSAQIDQMEDGDAQEQEEGRASGEYLGQLAAVQFPSQPTDEEWEDFLAMVNDDQEDLPYDDRQPELYCEFPGDTMSFDRFERWSQGWGF